jgi:hypothetical protein
MVEPGNVYLASVEGRIWLTDQFVILDVTGFSAVQELEDGWYRIVASGANAGLRPREKGPSLNIANWIKEIRGRSYCPATATEISFTDSEAKAMLLFVEVSEPIDRAWPTAIRYPVAMNEDVWRSFKTAWPDAKLSHPGYAGPFRISIPGHKELAYVEPIQIPEHLQPVAVAIIDVY